MLLETADANVIPESQAARRKRCVYCQAAYAVILFTLQIAGDDTEISACAEEKRSKKWRPHHDVGNRKAPSAGLARDAANMKAESNHSISQRQKTSVTKKCCGELPAKDCANTRSRKGAGENNRRIHYGIRVAALVMLIGDLHTADDARASHQ